MAERKSSYRRCREFCCRALAGISDACEGREMWNCFGFWELMVFLGRETGIVEEEDWIHFG
jgi:hypothetical protein